MEDHEVPCGEVSEGEPSHIGLNELSIEHEGGMFPYQATGTLGEDHFYFRYRSDNAQLSVGPLEDNPRRDWDPMLVHPPRLYAEIFDVFDDPMRGWLSKEEAHELMYRLVEMLRPPSEWEHGTHYDRLMAIMDAMPRRDQGQVITDEINADPEETVRLAKSRDQAREGKTTPLSELS